MRRVALGAALTPVLALAQDASRPASTVSPGARLPALEGETLSGKRLTLAGASAGRATLLIFTFSRKGGESARPWTEAAAGLGNPGLATYRILVLGGVPRLLRWLVVGGIEKGMPAVLHDTTVKLFADEDAWKARLGVRAEDDPHLVLLDTEGAIRWLHSGACDDAGRALLAERIGALRP